MDGTLWRIGWVDVGNSRRHWGYGVCGVKVFKVLVEELMIHFEGLVSYAM